MPPEKADAGSSELASLLALVLSLTNRLSVSDTFLKHGLAISEWALLEVLPADGSGMTVRKLGTLMGLSPQRVKVLIAKLEGRGIVHGSFVSEKSISRCAITSAGASLKVEAKMAISDMQVAALSASQIRGLARSIRIVRRLLKTPAPRSAAC